MFLKLSNIVKTSNNYGSLENYLFIFAAWVFLAACGLSLAVDGRGYSLAVGHRVLCSGFSYCRALPLGHSGFTVSACRVSYLETGGVFLDQ